MAFLHSYSKITTLDMHTGGEPLRIILEGFPSFEGMDILDIRREMEARHDHLRKRIIWEPRGHTDMYGLLKVPPQREDSAFGVIFMHNAGYSTMCGHATIAIGKAAIKLGWVRADPPITRFNIDAPCGQLKVFVHHREDGEVEKVAFENVPSFYVGTYQLDLPPFGRITYDIAYGGAFYAYLDMDQLDMRCEPAYYGRIVAAGKAIKQAVIRQNDEIRHPFEEDLGFLYGCIFIDRSNNPGVHSKNVCVFADGEVDRSPTGSGVSGRAAIHFHRGELRPGEEILIESILERRMAVSIREVGPFQAVVPMVSGQAYFTGYNEFWIDPEDPLKDGFLLH